MKRRYTAMILGLALAMTSVSAYAESTEVNGDSAAEAISGDILAEVETNTEAVEIYGEVTDLTEDSITISTGIWTGPEATGVLKDAEEERSSFLEFDGEEQTLTLNEETNVFRYMDAILLSTPEEVMEETVQNVELAAEDEESMNEAETPAAEDTDLTNEENSDEEEVSVEELELSDIKIGDIVKISCDEDGTVTAITVIMYAPAEAAAE